MNGPEDVSKEAQLLAILQQSGMLKAAQQMVAKIEDKKRKTVKVNGKQWRYANVTTVCRHCRSTITRTTTLKTSAESFTYIGPEDQVYVVTYRMCEEPVEVFTHTGACDKCKEYIAGLDREILESMYYNLLLKSDRDSKHPPIRPPERDKNNHNNNVEDDYDSKEESNN